MRTSPQCVRGPLARIPCEQSIFAATGLFLFAFVSPSYAQVYEKIYSFTESSAPNKGRQPYAGLVQGNDGNFYGTTQLGGVNNLGTVFRMTPGGVLTTLVEFTENGPINKGREPQSPLIQGSDGNFYG